MQPLGSSKARWAAALAAAVVVLSGVTFVLFRGGFGEQEANTASASDQAITKSETPTTTHSVTVSNTHTSASAGGSSPVTGTPPPDLVNWLQGGGLQQTSGLLEDSALVLGHTNLANSCESLARNVHTAKAYRPIPDDATQRIWAGALAGFDHAASGCATGASTKEIGVSSDALKQVMTRLSDLAR